MAENYSIENIACRGGRISYLHLGQGSRTLVVIPGLNVRSVLNNAEYIALAYKEYVKHDYSVYVIDRKITDAPAYQISDLAEDALSVVNALKLEHIHLLGHSQGGMIVQNMVLLAPDLADRMVLSATTSHLSVTSRSVMENWVKLAKSGDCSALYQSFEKDLYTSAYASMIHASLMKDASAVTEDELRRFIPATESMYSFDTSALLRNIHIPVFAIGGALDRVFEADLMRELAQKTKGKLYLYEGGSHCAIDEERDFHSRIIEFLS